MRLLFVTNKNVDPIIGGIERITYVLAKAFSEKHGFVCYSAYTQKLREVPSVFEKELLLSSGKVTEEINAFVKQQQIDFIIAQGSDAEVNSIMGNLRGALQDIPQCRLIFVFHNMPGFEYTSMSYPVLFYRIFHGQHIGYNLKYLLFQTFQPLGKSFIRRQLKKKYLPAYLFSDRVVVLTADFAPMYADYIGVPCDKKFVSINNSLTLETDFSMEQYDVLKQKEVLWVGRFDDRHKRFSLALKIWKEVERSGRFPDWKLRVVGYGEDEDYYRRKVKQFGLKQIFFEGKKDSQIYYPKAKIFMMTSAFEGFGLVLTEAQQYGVVPIAFDTFAALHDIIADGQNGFIISEKDLMGYTTRLQQLMENGEKCRAMAAQALKNVEKFSVDNISRQWLNLLQQFSK